MIDALLRLLMLRRKPALQAGDENALLNYSLELAQEWGTFWMKPIQSRLRKAYPSLSEAELDRLDGIARSAMDAGYGLVYSMAEIGRKRLRREDWIAAYHPQFPWVDDRNLRQLFSTGLYYAMKDGVGS